MESPHWVSASIPSSSCFLSGVLFQKMVTFFSQSINAVAMAGFPCPGLQFGQFFLDFWLARGKVELREIIVGLALIAVDLLFE